MSPGKSRQSFGSELRLHYPREYRRFFDGAELFRLRICAIFRIPNELGCPRLGITLKARGRSVDRNRVKRAIREAFRIHQQNLGHFDYNVVVPGTLRLSFEFAQQLADVLAAELPRLQERKPETARATRGRSR